MKLRLAMTTLAALIGLCAASTHVSADDHAPEIAPMDPANSFGRVLFVRAVVA